VSYTTLYPLVAAGRI